MAAKRKATSKARSAPAGPSFVVGLGGSAGGLDAYEQFFSSTSVDSGMAFVLVTHLDPDHKALLPELVQRTTRMPVREIENGVRLAANAVYVIPPNRELTLEGDVLRLRPVPRKRGARTPIDAFFLSLASRGPTAIGVVLSGMGADGAQGLRAIHDAGGRVLVQDPASAAFDAMPRAAIAAVPEAEVGPPDLLAGAVARAAAPPVAATTKAASEATMARVLDVLRQRTGHDLRLYKQTSIERRLERRLVVHGLSTLEAYLAYLEANPEEAELLFRELLIGVTHFFRDDAAFVVLRQTALPELLAAKEAPRTLRAWVAGCSSGEEAYSLAIVIHEVLAQGGGDVAVQIYATDVDAGAIAVARTGRYGADIAEHVSPERLARYFIREDDGYRIRKEIRETVVFAQHDLIRDPPFTRLDLLLCRNVLIYLQPVLQQQLLPQFHYALDVGGLLVLGPSEALADSAALFAAVDAKAKLFRRLDGVRAASPRPRVPLPVVAAVLEPLRHSVELTMIEAARRTIVDSVAPPTVVINDRGDVLYASRRTGKYLEPAVGKTNLNVFAMAREGLGPHLSLAVRQAIARRRRVTHANLTVRGDRGRHCIDLIVVPMDEPVSVRGLLLVVFQEVTPAPKPAARGKATGKATGPAGRELARLKAHVHMVVREMETAQALVETTNEELQSANEELQSTNEEVTTSKEELQSLNEELMSLNAELEAKNDQLVHTNDDLRNLLDSTKVATLFLDKALRVRRFTSEATRIAHLLPGDVGRAITDITLALDYGDLAADVGEVLKTLVVKEVQVAAADGTTYTMRIHPYRTMQNVVDGVVITFSDVTVLRRAEEVLATAAHEGVISNLLDRWPGMVCVRDLAVERDVYLNARARERLRAASAGSAGATRFDSLLHPDDAAEAQRWDQRLDRLQDGEVLTRSIRLRGAAGAYARFRERESVLARSVTGTPTRVLAILDEDATERS